MAGGPRTGERRATCGFGRAGLRILRRSNRKGPYFGRRTGKVLTARGDAVPRPVPRLPILVRGDGSAFCSGGTRPYGLPTRGRIPGYGRNGRTRTCFE